MAENVESGVLVETDWGTVVYERMPDGRRRAHMLKDGAYRERIEGAETLGVAYTRFSSHGQNESTTEMQLEMIFAMAKREGTAIVEAYCDEGRTGTNDRRPEFQRMVADVKGKRLEDVPKRRRVSVVAVYKLDRFSRGRYDPGYYKYILGKVGARVVSASEPIPDGAIGPLVESNLEAAAAFFSAQLSERVVEYMHAHALACETNGVYVAGYERGPEKTYVLDRPLCYEVARMFDELHAGMTPEQVERIMSGVVDRRGRAFDADRIAKVARDRRYVGEYRYSGVVVPGGMPSLVDESEFDAVQTRLQGWARRKLRKRSAASRGKPAPPSRKKLARLRYKHNIKGRRFGWLKVVEVARIDKNHHRVWLCECRCGRRVEVYATRLKSGRATDCGCLSGDGRARDERGRFA